MRLRSALMTSIALSVLLSTPSLSFAEDGGEQAQIKMLQQQIQALQEQLNQLAAAQKKAAAAVAAAPAPVASAPAATTATASSGTGSTVQNAIYQSTGVKVTAGGYIEAAGIYRNKNENADLVSNFNAAIPFNNNVNAHQSEFRGTARGTRLSLLAEATPDQNTKLLGYVETDFLSNTGANSIETNSYAPRLRQAYVGYERNDWGLDVYAGQVWSLATLFKQGLSPRSEALPPGIEVATMPGFTYVRGPGLRVIKELDDKQVSIGFAAESPETNFGQVAIPANVTATSSATSGTFSVANSTEVAPDLVAKVAVDPGFGHFEAFGLMRFLHDNINSTLRNDTVIAGGGGLGAYVPVIDKYLDFQANAMYGAGIGRYGPALLPDYSFSPDGGINPIREYMGSVGFTGHPTPTWMPYVFAGYEKAMRNASGTSGYGYGNPSISNAGCYVNNGSCSATTSDIWQVTAGVWKDLYKGNYGTMKVGLQDSLTRRSAFSDAAGLGPHSYENMILTSFRYYPF